jgi:hypothetical protein
MFDPPDASITLMGGNLASALDQSFTFGLNNRVLNTTDKRLRISFASGTGVFRGTITDPTSNRVVSYGGVTLQKQNTAAGFFIRDDQSGEVEITPQTGTN